MEKIKVAILDDHQPIVDGYCYRLIPEKDIEVVGTALNGADLEALLASQAVDVLLLDVQVPTSADNANPYPILHIIPRLLELYPDLTVLVISMYAVRALIQSVMDSGASGYVLKDDPQTMRDLASVIRMVAEGSIYLSQDAYHQWRRRPTGGLSPGLSPRELQVISLCTAYPNASTADLAKLLHVANSTVRNLLSSAYLKLEVNNRTAAVLKARHKGLITPGTKELDPRILDRKR